MLRHWWIGFVVLLWLVVLALVSTTRVDARPLQECPPDCSAEVLAELQALRTDVSEWRGVQAAEATAVASAQATAVSVAEARSVVAEAGTYGTSRTIVQIGIVAVAILAVLIAGTVARCLS